MVDADKRARVLVNDYAGHPFQVQLSRQLARRGFRVLHTYCASVETPRGRLAKGTDDPGSFDIEAISLEREFKKYGLLSRAVQELELGRELRRVVREFRPDAVISANTPLFAQSYLLRASKRSGARFVFWVQDVLGVGIKKAIRRRIPILGGLIGNVLIQFERHMLRRSDSVVLITEDFKPFVPKSVLNQDRACVIENWAPLDEIPRLPKDNEWSRKHGLADKRCLVYSGTLGLKHNPELLVRLGETIRGREDTRLVVITQGLGAEHLSRAKSEKGLDNLVLMPFQPFEDLPKVLGTADVLLGILEPSGGVFAVPSKILSYLCAGRPIVLACPQENLAARVIENSRAGVVVKPNDERGFVREALALLGQPERGLEAGENGWRYAEQQFDIDRIAGQFEVCLAVGPGR